ncbi:TPR domain protein [Calycina marina]|uniref:TPR domain protein n=1 Tax=Calycina marina TaxID=1763456 RepID=A0A9P8CBA6_9HELO|nr:TPR domain protein [Calycina marina]
MKNAPRAVLAGSTNSKDYYDLGAFHRSVTTGSRGAQLWFDRGFIWSYAFNHEEAVECFQKAVEEDPKCAMAYWGLAYAIGPNYNKQWDAMDAEDQAMSLKRTHEAVIRAKERYSGATVTEKALIDAIQFRYPQNTPAKHFKIWNDEYAKAMRSVYRRFPDDLDVAALYVDSLMNLTPWKLWDLRTGKPAHGAHTLEAKLVLDKTFKVNAGLQHPGLLHLYIHLMEMSGTPENALTVADHLRGLVPDSGHLNHMPSHIDILCGEYRRAIASNSDAIRVDEKFVKHRGALNFYTLYRSHNYHFRIYAAMFSGQSRIALDTVDELEESIPEEVLRIKSPPMANYLEHFMSMRVHVLIRFGRWQDLKELKLPKDERLYCMTTAMIHYGKAIASAVNGLMKQAHNERTLFQAAMEQVPSSRSAFNNKCSDILTIAAAMLDGEISYREGSYDVAFASLLKSINLGDSLHYDEPWGWMQPARHAYGALMLEQGHVKEAAAVYSADLGFDESLPRALRHMNNVWALHGYHECLVKLGRTAEARIIEPQLRLALAIADIPIRSSCLCRLKTLL